MRFLLITAAAVAIFAAPPIAPLAAARAPRIEVLRPWSRPAVAGTNGVGYMVLTNHGRAVETLEKVESPIASRVEMHSSSMAGGVMSMQREDKVTVPAGGQTIFGPGAYHLMLFGLTRTLKPGDEVPATLTFTSGAKVRVRFAVSEGPGPPAMTR